MTERGEQTKVQVISKYLKFSGATGLFSYYDKEAEENKEVMLHNDPLGFVLLTTGYNIQGFDERAGCKIYSNEIKSLKNEEFVVRSFKDGEMFRGKYADIKEKVLASGCHLNYCLTYLDEEEVKRICFKGMSFFNVSEAIKKIDINKYKIRFVGCEDGEKGAVKFKTPVLEQGGEITKAENELADEKMMIIKMNRNITKQGMVEEKEEIVAPKLVETENNFADEDLPFN